ncbi:tape measure protein [Cognaticolwellia mytili]|uniref:tape measure protein n=1 Tax=Cognaticolwellia mytili TaxID=1888913 RepID=UPI000A16F9AF|nr:tape measure protein [Cognaticolwellia mytili]
MSDDLKLAIRLTTEGGKIVVKDLQQIDAATDKVNHSLTGTAKSGQTARKGFEQASMGAKNLTRHSKEASNELQGMLRNMGLMVTGYVTLNGAMRGINKADSFNVLTQRIETATKATGDFVTVNAELYQITQDNRANLESTVEMFQRMSSARAELEATNAEMLVFTDTIQELGVIGGTSLTNIQAGQTQLAQMLSSNVARAEEFNSILENIPEVAQRMAKGLGVSVGKLREMMLNGQLLSKDVFRAILSQTQQVHADFNDIDKSVASTGQKMDNSIGKALSRLDEVSGTTKAIAKSFDDIANALDAMNASELKELAGTIAAIGGSIAALIFLKKLNVNLATMAIASGTATKSILGKVAAMRASTITTNVYGQVVASTATKITATTIATRALTIATRALLGPIGLAITAGYMIYDAFAPNEIDKSADATIRLAKAEKKVAEAAKAAALAKVAQKPSSNMNDHLQAAYQKQAMLIAQIASMHNNLESVNSTYGKTSKLATDYGLQLQENEKSLANTKRLIASILIAQQQQSAEINNQAIAKKVDPAAQRQLAQIQQQIALFGELSLVKQLDYQLTSGNLKGVSSELALQLHLETKKLNLLKSQKKVRVETKANQKLIASLGQELKALKLSDKQKLISAKLSQLSANATDEQKQKVRELTETLYDQTAAYDALDLSDLTEQTNNYGSAWSNVGNTIIDTFGSMADKFANLGEMQDGYLKQLEAIKVKRKSINNIADIDKRTKGLAELKTFENNVIKQNTQAQLGAYGSIAGAASEMFSEQSKGREALHRLEVGFMAAEMVLSIQKSILNATEAVTNAGTSGDPYSAPARVAAMAAIMAGVLGAVGIAFSSGSGGGISAADRQASQGTGTVLGDSSAHSQSISNSFERIEQLELDQYVVLQEMNSSLRSLDRSIPQLVASLVRMFGSFNENNYGGELGSVNTGRLPGSGLLEKSLTAFDPTGLVSKIIGGFSKTKKSLVDSGISIVGQTLGEIMSSGLVNAQAYFDIKTKKKKFWGLSSKTSYNTEYQDLGSDFNRSLGLIFNDLGTTINESIDILGLDIAKETATFSNLINNRRFDGEGFEAYFENLTSGIATGISESATRSLENFEIELPKMSFKDMSGEEIEKALQGMISQQADKMVQYLVPQIAKFQQVGEGLYDTLVRVAQEQAIFNSAMDAMGHSISGVAGMTKQMETEIAQSIITLTGGLENFREYTSTYFSEFLTDEQQFSHLKKQITGLFDGLELSLPDTRAEFITLMDGIDRTTESGQALYASLLRMIGSLDGYYDATEKATKAEEKLAQTRIDFVASFEDKLARLDMSPLQIKLADLQKTFDAYREQASEYGLGTELIEALYAKERQQIIDDALASINDTHKRELDTLNREHEQSLAELNRNHTQAVEKLTADHERFVASLDSVNAAIANNILTIRRSFKGWDEAAYQSGKITNLRGNLNTGTADERLSVINELNDALLNKYNAEIAQNNELASLATERHQAEVSRHEELLSLVDDLRAAAKSLKFGDLSTLSHTQQFSLAKSDFQQALSTGDIKNLRSSGEQYLNLAKAQYGGTASSEYQAIFDQVTNAFSSASAGAAPSVPSEVLQFQNDNIALGEQLIVDLAQLRTLTGDLEAEQKAVFETRLSTLNADLLAQTEVLNNELVLQTATLALKLETQTTAIVGAIGGVETAIGNIQIPAPITPPPIIIFPPKSEIGAPAPLPPADPNSKRLAEAVEKQNALAEAQTTAIEKQNALAQQSNNIKEALEMRLAENNDKLEQQA